MVMAETTLFDWHKAKSNEKKEKRPETELNFEPKNAGNSIKKVSILTENQKPFKKTETWKVENKTES